jgi:hypothetical protein
MGNPHRDKDRRRRRDGGEFGNQMEDAFARYGKIDVSVAGQRPDAPRQDRGGGNYRGGRGGGGPERGNDRYERRPARPKLEFSELISFDQGDCRCRVTAADGQSGRIYNFAVERQNRDRTTRFFREYDAQDLVTLVSRAADWIAAQRG